jgi:hypothetical protein
MCCLPHRPYGKAVRNQLRKTSKHFWYVVVICHLRRGCNDLRITPKSCANFIRVASRFRLSSPMIQRHHPFASGVRPLVRGAPAEAGQKITGYWNRLLGVSFRNTPMRLGTSAGHLTLFPRLHPVHYFSGFLGNDDDSFPCARITKVGHKKWLVIDRGHHLVLKE